MAEIIRVRCPCCGMMTDLEKMAQFDEERPTEVRLFIQKFGGKIPPVEGEAYVKKGRGKASGFMEYEDVTKNSPEQVATLEVWFKNRAEQFLKKLAEEGK